MMEAGRFISGITSDALEQHYKKIVVSSGKLEFTITDDIKNVNGALLMKAGKKIDEPTCRKILKHQLLRPLDEYLQFTNQVTKAALVEDIIDVGQAALVGTRLDFNSVVKSINDIVNELHYDQTMLNKLTVYKYDSANKFDHSLAVALLANEIGKLLNYSNHQLADLFSASLLHDLGEMYIEKSVYNKDELDDNDYRVIATHPVLSYVLLRESRTDFSSQVLSAVLNHHERLDQSGYPRGLGGKYINRYARIVALVDTYDALRRKGRSSSDALWAIKIQGHCRSIAGEVITPAFEPQLIEMLESLISDASEESLTSSDIPLMEQKSRLFELLTKLNSINDDVVQLWKNVESYLRWDAFSRSARQLQQAQVCLHNVKDLILASSGFVGVNCETFLNDETIVVGAQKDLYRMAPELKNQLARIKAMLSDIDGHAQDGRLVKLLSLNRSAYKKCSELYRTMVIESTLH
jgi:HD-GYP domain-containing protein (c-di-GMP phosphodiesterase class II)